VKSPHPRVLLMLMAVSVIETADREATRRNRGCQSRCASPVWGDQNQGCCYLWPVAWSWTWLWQLGLRQ